MVDGSTKPIKAVRIGEKVLATDPVAGRTEARLVDDVLIGASEKHLVEITVDTDGNAGDATGTVTATEGHPFWLGDQRGWTRAGEIEPGAMLRTSAGTWVQVVKTREWTAVQQVFNLTVADIHTYYVVAGTTPVLVHNAIRYCDISDFRAGDELEHTLKTDKGDVGMLAEITIDGDTLHLGNISVYGDNMERGALDTMTIMRELRQNIAPAAARQGFKKLRITAERLTGNPGHQVDFTLDLSRFAQ